MAEQKFVYTDVDYLKELEETAKKVDYYKGIVDGINMVIDRKAEPRKEQNFCGKCRYLYRDFKYGLSCYRLMDNEPCEYEERKDEPQTEVETMSCQECKHFHENAVMYLDQCDFCFKDCKYEPKTEPQMERSE